MSQGVSHSGLSAVLASRMPTQAEFDGALTPSVEVNNLSNNNNQCYRWVNTAAGTFVGENGITPAVLRALDEALTSHELVKIRLRQPEDKKGAARDLAEGAGAALCGVVGHTVVLYRPHPESPEIKLPGHETS